MRTAKNTHNQRETHLRDSKRVAQRLYCIVCTKASASCVDSGKNPTTKKMDDKQKNEREGAIMFHFEVVGKSHGYSPQALSQSVGLTDLETSKPLRLPTAHPTPHDSEALYA